jgi:phosphoglycerol transferase MdoB-like AlkP superfamily enzyme
MLALMMLIRMLFAFANEHVFHTPAFKWPGIIAGGLRFDLVTFIYLNGIFILLHLLPFPVRDHKIFQKILFILYLLFNIPVIIIELIDIAYYPFNNKRMSSDITGVASAGLRNSFRFMIDYWYLLFLLIFFIYIISFYYPRFKKKGIVKYNYFLQVALFFVGAGLCVIGARGGVQTIPITPANTADHTEIKFAPLVLNSTYSILYSLQRKGVEEKHYLSDEQTENILKPYKQITSAYKKKNVMLIILESYAAEYIGFLNNNSGYTPFTDSLFRHSLVFPACYANAERSNKSMCVLLGGIPSLTDDAFMNTIYSADCFKGTGTYLKENGYYTSFFHGGLNGEFKFDLFTKAAGFDHYFGKNEFNNDQLFDGNWGIYDDAFFIYTADEINKQPQPFCTALFSLSAHHPFNIPSKFRNRFPKGPEPIHEAIGYTDYALQQFFSRASKMKWFKNTVFLITADHTFGYGNHPSIYNNAAGHYRVPFAIYDPSGDIKPGIDSLCIQHLDIEPTMLHIGGYNGKVRCYGNSALTDKHTPAVQLRDNIYQAEDNQYILFFDGAHSAGLYDYRNDPELKKDVSVELPERKSELENYLKALVQDYHHSLIHNSLCR